MTRVRRPSETRNVTIDSAGVLLRGDLALSRDKKGLIIFAHGSGSGRFSPRNRCAAATLQEAGFATLLIDLLTEDEERADRRTAEFRFNIRLLADRLLGCARWSRRNDPTRLLSIGYFGASTGAAAALIAAAESPDDVFAVVSRGGRPDLAGDFLTRVRAPTLFIVGGRDLEVLALNREASDKMTVERSLKIVAGASHLFEESGALEEAARAAAEWFLKQIAAIEESEVSEFVDAGGGD